MGWVNRAGFQALFDASRRSVWRLETRDEYHEPDEAEPLRRFLAGEPSDLEWIADFYDWVHAATLAGKRFERVRVIADPPTDYQRFLVSFTPAAVAKGEDIRLIDADRAAALHLGGDFWMFDDHLVAVMQFGDKGVTGAEVITDSVAVERYRAIRQRAWAAATPFPEWVCGEHPPPRNA
ncbi:DUF6879 family protein [Actinokineospora sp.]|uniref:DUF6879 family protein n=1 Tax=Actinokineospora sp. TaxID=1872133 RepID=UPI003D6B154F